MIFLIGYDLCLIIVFIQSFKITVQTFYFTYGEPGLFTNLFIHWFCSQSCLHYDFFDFLIGYDLCLIIVFIQSFKSQFRQSSDFLPRLHHSLKLQTPAAKVYQETYIHIICFQVIYGLCQVNIFK